MTRTLLGRNAWSVKRGAATVQPTYAKPKVGAFDYSATVDTARVQLAAKFDLVLRDFSNASYFSNGGTCYTFLSNVRAQNIVNGQTGKTLLGVYTILSQCNTGSGAGTLYSQFATALDTGGTDGKGWWALDSAGQKTNAQTGYVGWYEVNHCEDSGGTTSPVSKDSSSRRWPQVLANALFGTSGTFKPMVSAGLLDFIFNDNTFYAPRADNLNLGGSAAADYNLDGVNEAVSSESTKRVTDLTIRKQYRQGYADYWAAAQSLASGLKIVANTDVQQLSGYSDIAKWQCTANTAEITGKCDFATIENFVGSKTYGLEYSYGFASNFSILQNAASGAKTAALALNYIGDSVNNYAQAYRFARYGAGICWLIEKAWPVNADEPSGGSMQPIWFDEYDAALGSATESACTAARTGTDTQGVNWTGTGLYARRYQGGIVIVNPMDNRGNWTNRMSGVTASRTSNVVTITHSSISTWAPVAGEQVKLEGWSNTSFNGFYTVSASSSGSTLVLNGASGQADVASFTPSAGWIAFQSTVNLTGQGYKHLSGTNDTHNNYNGTVGVASDPSYTSQNDGTTVTTLKLWAQDAVVLLSA